MYTNMEAFQKAENYILGRMNSEELRSYEITLSKDLELNSEVEVFRELIYHIRRYNLDPHLTGLRKKFERIQLIKRIFKFLGLLSLFACCLFLWGFPREPISTLTQGKESGSIELVSPSSNGTVEPIEEQSANSILSPDLIRKQSPVFQLTPLQYPLSIPQNILVQPQLNSTGIFLDPNFQQTYTEFLSEQGKQVVFEQYMGQGYTEKAYRQYLLALSNFKEASLLNPSPYVDNEISKITQIIDSCSVKIEGGPFLKGSKKGLGRREKDHKVVHENLIRSFWVDRREVTAEEFCFFLNSPGAEIPQGVPILVESEAIYVFRDLGGKYQPIPGKELFPMVGVTWYGADAYARHFGKRLPTEAEWEYMAKLAKIDTIDFDPEIVPVDQSVNSLNGIWGLRGSAGEWCSDWYGADYYQLKERDNPQGPNTGSDKVIRSGFLNGKKQAAHSRAYARPEIGLRRVGFRCVFDEQ